jgi:hypothetical protein
MLCGADEAGRDQHETGHLCNAVQRYGGTKSGGIDGDYSLDQGVKLHTQFSRWPDSVTGTLMPAQGGQASFESEVTLTGETSFKETGTIRFGDSNHSLRFSTLGKGFLGKSP